ncbi:MAG: NADH-quinone oxidoreductase subunit M [Planctomycetes bacterium]|nr:NADH-quinone oxidoreductase subunit M [Planctomycetota bacterium]
MDFLAAAFDPQNLKHHLSVITFLPLVGALFVTFINGKRAREIKATAIFFSLITFVASLPILFEFKQGANFQMVESVAWIPAFNIRYAMGVDGISLFLVLLTTLLGPIVMLSCSTNIHKRVKEFFIAMLVLETGVIGSFCALDLFLFYVFFELMLIPMYLLIGVWGSDPEGRRAAAIKFFVYTLVGSLLMFLAVLYIANLAGTFDIRELTAILPAKAASGEFSKAAQYVCFLAFMLSFAVKTPLFPFHTWLPDAHTEAPTGGSVVLAGVLLKLGTYGMLRFAIPLFPEPAFALGPAICVLAVIGVIYGSMMAIAQLISNGDWKRMVAYSSVGHMGFIVLGIFSFNLIATQGALIQSINHGLSTGLLFLLIGIVYERRHTRLFDEYGGIAKVMPKFAILFMIATLASVGLPGTNGFVGEFLILIGTFGGDLNGLNDGWSWNFHSTMAVLAATGVVLGAVYMLWSYQRVFFGKITKAENMSLKDVTTTELTFAAPIIALIFLLGVAPGWFLSRTEDAVRNNLEQSVKAAENIQAQNAKRAEASQAGK